LAYITSFEEGYAGSSACLTSFEEAYAGSLAYITSFEEGYRKLLQMSNRVEIINRKTSKQD
jgi:hypothetical protein